MRREPRKDYNLRVLRTMKDRHVTRNGDPEPVVDPSQDYMLMLGYENATHTVLRFRRKLDTCDPSHDIAITLQVKFMPSASGGGDVLPDS
ncbi:hypothetical protein M5D96_009309 [Drosophila gunungcola]|uniref:DOMON domain-containing protein n=1 Tax=Drosophila gunungcola TaxID=103775 RepID=A0A9P9YJM2_9MUSC|nr:hypothetical protein M5D96_009309 [Drosophila gunungcola]